MIKNIYGKYLPSQKAFTRIILKSLFAVFLSGILFSLFLLTYLGISRLNDSSEIFLPISELFDMAKMIVTGTTLWTLVIASPPTVLISYLLTAIIYRDFKKGNNSRGRAIKTGALFAGLTMVVLESSSLQFLLL
jgi:hypothetical protein